MRWLWTGKGWTGGISQLIFDPQAADHAMLVRMEASQEVRGFSVGALSMRRVGPYGEGL